MVLLSLGKEQQKKSYPIYRHTSLIHCKSSFLKMGRHPTQKKSFPDAAAPRPLAGQGCCLLDVFEGARIFAIVGETESLDSLN